MDRGIRQALTRSDQTTYGNTILRSLRLSAVAEPTDTLSFDASGNFVGNDDQWATQSYASNATGACYSRVLISSGGEVASVTDGGACRPSSPQGLPTC